MLTRVMSRRGFIEKLTFEQGPEAGEVGGPLDECLGKEQSRKRKAPVQSI